MYAKVESNVVVEYPIVNLSVMFPNISFPAVILDDDLPEGIVRVHNAPFPQYNPATHRVSQLPQPEFVDEQWQTAFEIVQLTPDELDERVSALIQSITQETQKRLDDFAKTRNYDGILSACTYATSTVVRFAEEGQYAVNARDVTWATLYSVMAEVEAGTRPMPAGYADIEPLLPALAWPLVQ